jgi:group I intron endonuclease
MKPDKIYIGSAIDIPTRWSRHLSDLKLGRHCNKKLQRHYNKYASDLSFSILLECETKSLLEREQHFIDSLNPWFNVCKVAGSQLGVKQSKKTCKKHSEANKRRGPISEETRNRLRKSHQVPRPWRRGIKLAPYSKEAILNKSRAMEIVWLNRKLKKSA